MFHAIRNLRGEFVGYESYHTDAEDKSYRDAAIRERVNRELRAEKEKRESERDLREQMKELELTREDRP